MSLFEKIFGKKPLPKGKRTEYFKTLNAYTPAYSSWQGSVYESEIVRAAVNAIATHISKLTINFTGAAKGGLKSRLLVAPNEWQTWSQFLYRAATIREIESNCFIVPVTNEFGETTGIYTVLPQRCEIMEYDGVPYLRYTFSNGQVAAVELSRVGVLQKFQFKDDFFGTSNSALMPTMDMITMQQQGIQEAIRQNTSYRFMAQLGSLALDEDLVAERKRFTAMNLRGDADNDGMLLFPYDYTNIKQIESKPFVIDADQMKLIQTNVFNYFGVNEKVLQNAAFGDAWSAFYEGVVEVFAIQFSEVLSKMLFSVDERKRGNACMASANRLQYMSNADKLSVSSEMVDRGIMNRNEAREIWNMPPVEGGDSYIIRGEYYNADDKLQEGGNNDGE